MDDGCMLHLLSQRRDSGRSIEETGPLGSMGPCNNDCEDVYIGLTMPISSVQSDSMKLTLVSR